MDSSSFIEVPRPPYHCEACYRILFGEYPPYRISQFDQTICIQCSRPVGFVTRRKDTAEDLSDGWVPIDAKKDAFSLDEGKADWVTIHDTDLDSSVSSSGSDEDDGAKTKEQEPEPESEAEEGGSKDKSSSPVIVFLTLGLPHPDSSTRLTTPTVDLRESRDSTSPKLQTPGVAASVADTGNADSGKPKNEKAP
ncbi:hypothetical protein F4776DRAFT_627032 [Hypoxylon sp. NC0597]|nr:hypothetical protein F4776DRAFT_627032 [Hypoxylon sp. NC0597]